MNIARGACDMHKNYWLAQISTRAQMTTIPTTKPLLIERAFNRDVVTVLMVYEMLLLQ